MKISCKGKNGFTITWYKGFWEDTYREMVQYPDGDILSITHNVSRSGVAYGVRLAKENGMVPVMQHV